ncbi:MAG TPA: hypothetical protein VLG48_09880, partial [Candidatus Methylomirabilis sp.]|nr:hypothetical protein [Candidatus Methylomirabilis sp.]
MTQAQLQILVGALAILLVSVLVVLVVILRRRPGEEVATNLLANLQAALGDLGTRVGQLSGEVQGVARSQEGVRTE